MDRVEVVKIPIPQKPIILNEILKPDPQGPATYVLERAFAVNLITACEDFKLVGQEGFKTLAEVQEEYPGVDQSYACDFAVYGLSPDAQMNFEAELIELRSYADKLRARIEFYIQQLLNQYESLTAKPEKENPQ